MTWDEFEDQYRGLLAAFPRQTVPAETQSVYFAALRELDATTFRAAALDCRDTLDWFPTIRQLKERCDEHLTRAGVLPPHATSAWQHVWEYARRWSPDVGHLDRDTLSDLEVQALRRIGGIVHLTTLRAGEGSGYEIDQTRREFLAAYEGERAWQIHQERLLARPLPERQLLAITSGGADG